MAFELLLDENVEHDVLYNLRNRGHDVEHVEFIPELGKGTRDGVVAEYSRDTNRAIVSYDDDFRDNFTESDYYGFVFVPDDALSSGQVAAILDEMSRHFDQPDLRGLTSSTRVGSKVDPIAGWGTTRQSPGRALMHVDESAAASVPRCCTD
jgi:hypothetical protein